jgi:anti-sigma factor ChrR (cupin superfamily)
MLRLRTSWPLFILAIFWIAQVQGTVHAIGHLRSVESTTKASHVAQSGVCAECAALSQARSAPTTTRSVTSALSPANEVPTTDAVLSVATTPDTFYRSRAPPTSPV